MCRSKELQINESDAKVKLQSRTSELNSLEHDLNQVKEGNQREIETSKACETEIDALTQHMNLITQQNYELSTELQRFLQTDEVVKSKLNRRSTVEEIRHRVDTAIKRSQAAVTANQSPRRSSIERAESGGRGSAQRSHTPTERPE